MRHMLLILTLLFALPAHAQIWQAVDFGENPSTQSVSSFGAKVELSPQIEDDHFSAARVKVTIDGKSTVSQVVEGVQYGWKVGIGRMAPRDTSPTVIVQSFSGGAHCCFSVTAYRLADGRVRAIELYGGDGDGLPAWPTDLDGDGLVDFEFYDGALLYAFSSYAGSFGIPVILNIVGTAVTDNSDKPRFRNRMEKLSADGREACLDKDLGRDRNGGCAAHVFAEAKLGRLQSALRFTQTAAYNESDATYPLICKAGASRCPDDGYVKFRNFNEAMARFLRERGMFQ